MKRLVGLVLCLFVFGCSFFRRDLVTEGVYRVEASKFCGHDLAVTAWESGETLVVKGRVVDLPYSAGLPADAEVSLATPGGVEIARKRAAFRRWHKHRGRSHVYVQTEFEHVPPPGTLIRVHETSPGQKCGEKLEP